MDSPAHYVSRVRLVGIRSFRDLELQPGKDAKRLRRCLLIIGKNGTCKSTLLRALALALCDRSGANALANVPLGGFVSADRETGLIDVDLVASDRTTVTQVKHQIHRKGPSEYVDTSGWGEDPAPDVFACGYGASRYAVGPDPGHGYRVADSVRSLFKASQPMLDPELTLRRLNDFLGSSTYDVAMRGIKRVLGLQAEDEIRLPKGGGVVIAGPSAGGEIPLEGWADGYRVTFAWLLDLYGWAIRANQVTDEGGIRGIVLVDEIEQHLHPSMQTELISRFTEALPEAQLIATTHSPLVTLGADPEEVVALSRKGDVVSRLPVLPDFRNYSAEDVLEDPRLFDTPALRPELTRQMRRYNALIAKPRQDRSAEETGELRQLAQELGSQQIRVQRVDPPEESDLGKQVRDVLKKHGL